MSRAEELAKRSRRISEILMSNWTVNTLRVIKYCIESETELRRLAQVEAEHEALKKAISDAVPVAWLRDDGQDGSISTMTNCCSTKVKDLWLKANPIQVERYTIPLYTLEGIRTKP